MRKRTFFLKLLEAKYVNYTTTNTNTIQILITKVQRIDYSLQSKSTDVFTVCDLWISLDVQHSVGN